MGVGSKNGSSAKHINLYRYIQGHPFQTGFFRFNILDLHNAMDLLFPGKHNSFAIRSFKYYFSIFLSFENK